MPGHYLSFPDIGLTQTGRLLVVYREADKHVAKRSKLLLKGSDDRGKSWNPQSGLPDEYAKKRILELKNDRFASRGDYGYSGWIQFPEGEFLCAYHHGGGTQPGYQRGATAYILCTRFYDTDFHD
jgi:hypothetical protein